MFLFATYQIYAALHKLRCSTAPPRRESTEVIIIIIIITISINTINYYRLLYL